MSNHIYIIGAGAIGEALAVFLHLNKKQVTLIRGSVDDGRHYHKNIKVVKAERVLEAEIEINSLSNFSVLDGIVVITTKSFGNENLAQMLKDKIGSSPLVLLQNGLGVELPFVSLKFGHIYRCVLFVTSQKLDGEVKFKPVSACPIGVVHGPGHQLPTIVEQLTSSNFSFSAEQDIRPIVWKKAIVNSIFNSVCPLLEIDNGVFRREQAARMIAERMIDECLHVAKAKGITLRASEVLETLLQISTLSDGQLISTLQDIRRGRPTEIDTLNFAIVAIARTKDIGHLVTETKLLGELVRLKAKASQNK